jgi:TIR domain
VNGHVFISYSGTDRAYVGRLAAHLAGRNIPVWYDYEIAAGDRLATVIQQQIDTCAAFVVVLTPAAVASEWVHREISYAVHTRKPVLPLRLARCDVPIMLIDRHYEDVTGWRLPDARFLTRLTLLTAPAPALASDPVTADMVPGPNRHPRRHRRQRHPRHGRIRRRSPPT